MNDRANTLVRGRRERLERILERPLEAPTAGSKDPIPADTRAYLLSEAEDLYWNELEWEHITDEEALEQGALTALTFPGFLAYVRGLLLEEVMPDSLSPASPRPQVVEDVLLFLARRVLELEDGTDDEAGEDGERAKAELELAHGLIDQVLYLYHRLEAEEIERVEAAALQAG